MLLCLDCLALCQFLSGQHKLAKVGLYYSPQEVVAAALSTESSTVEELECYCQINILVRTFIHYTMRSGFDVCMMGMHVNMYMHLDLCMHASSLMIFAFGALIPDSQMMKCMSFHLPMHVG